LVRGRFALARVHLSEVDRVYFPATHRAFVQEAGVHPRGMALSFLGFTHFCLGYPDHAMAYTNAAIAEAQSEQHLPSIVQTLGSKTRLLYFLGDEKILTEYADRLSALGADHGFPYFRAQGLIYRGWTKVAASDFDNGVALIQQGISAWRATGALVWLPLFEGLEAQAEAARGQTDHALSILAEALWTSRERGENWYQAELLRQRGHLLQRADPATAEASFEEAIGVAQHQEAKLWELRAADNLARLRRDHGRRTEARDLLAPVYGWFTEGFDTADLKEAKALLDELS
jgi:predicted ATPase